MRASVCTTPARSLLPPRLPAAPPPAGARCRHPQGVGRAPAPRRLLAWRRCRRPPPAPCAAAAPAAASGTGGASGSLPTAHPPHPPHTPTRASHRCQHLVPQQQAHQEAQVHRHVQQRAQGDGQHTCGRARSVRAAAAGSGEQGAGPGAWQGVSVLRRSGCRGAVPSSSGSRGERECPAPTHQSLLPLLALRPLVPEDRTPTAGTRGGTAQRSASENSKRWRTRPRRPLYLPPRLPLTRIPPGPHPPRCSPRCRCR